MSLSILFILPRNPAIAGSSNCLWDYFRGWAFLPGNKEDMTRQGKTFPFDGRLWMVTGVFPPNAHIFYSGGGGVAPGPLTMFLDLHICHPVPNQHNI